MGIVDEDIARVRDATDIVALVTEHTQLKRVGRRWSGLCPFHNEKTPSFSVNGEEGFYHCFGCQKSGDVITFVREMDGLDFVGAVERLAARAGVALRYDDVDQGRDRRRRTKLIEAVDKAVEWYHQRLLSAPDAAAARGYLRSRGFDGDLVRRYRIGWAPDDWDALASGIDVDSRTLRDAGLAFENRAGRLQDVFRARVLFPIFTHDGSAVGFGGRIMPGADGPKYKNSAESAVYAKSKLLYGLNWARDEIVRIDEAVLCEGYTDVIGMATAGIGRAVATCGTALTDDHIKLLAKYTRRLVLAFDADAAGQAAAERIYAWEKTHELTVAVAELPGGADPGDLARSDPEALVAAVEGARPFLEFRVERILGAADLSSAEGRARAAARAKGLVDQHPDELVRDQYLMTIADRCRVDIDRLRHLVVPPEPEPVEPRRRRRRDEEPEHVDDGRRVPNQPDDGGSVDVDVAVARPAPREMPVLLLALHRSGSIPDYLDAAWFDREISARAFRAISAAGSVAEALAVEDAALRPLLAEMAVLDAPEDADGALSLFLFDVGEREKANLAAAARRSGDLEIARRMAEVQAVLEKVQDSDFEIGVAEQLVGLLPTAGEPHD
ncbi:MAG: DNA primase [Acidimicrobiales bacterium]